MSLSVMAGGGENVTPEVQAQSPLVTEILESLVGKVTLANATPETILEGYSTYVGQKLVQGTLEDTRRIIEFGSVTLSSTSKTIAVSHRLGVIPKYVLLVTELGQVTNSGYIGFLLHAKSPISSSNVNIYGWYSEGGYQSNIQSANRFADITNTTVTFKSDSYSFLNTTFNWMVMA